MAWARPPGAPELASCPLESLEPRYPEFKPFFSPFSGIVLGAAAGFIAPVGLKYLYRIPIYAGLPFTTLSIGVCAGLGYMIQRYVDILATDRDEVYRQYIKLHPQDFPPYKKVLIKDMFEPWKPNR